MSYATMDHAKWMEDQNAALNRHGSKRRRWKPLPEKLSEFQAKVIDIVGIVGGGIYNAPICSPERIEWEYGFGGVSLTWERELATWDGCQLTQLVFLCHAARIRCSIDAVAPRRFRLSFWQRKTSGDIAVWHPNLEQAVAMFRLYLPEDHRIWCREAFEEKKGD